MKRINEIVKKQKLEVTGSTWASQLAYDAPRGTGTITNRRIVDRAITDQMGKLNIGGKVKKFS